VYNEIYNVSFCGIENLHVFDSKKFRKVIAALEEKKLITKRQVEQPLNVKSWCYM
jgi:2-oxoglutarate dehydrogenase complex dehydrogenase (E1) component-like enzyme